VTAQARKRPEHDYWFECVATSLDENGVAVTEEQLAAVARDIESAHENYGQAFYQPENPMIGEMEELRRKLKLEREKRVCPECRGSGEQHSQGPYHGSISQCFRCRGEGRVSP
jgi:hypothetical protein